MIMNHHINAGSLTCPFLWADCLLEGWTYSFVVLHPMGNPASKHDDHIVVWTLRGFLVYNGGWLPLAQPQQHTSSDMSWA